MPATRIQAGFIDIETGRINQLATLGFDEIGWAANRMLTIDKQKSASIMIPWAVLNAPANKSFPAQWVAPGAFR